MCSEDSNPQKALKGSSGPGPTQPSEAQVSSALLPAGCSDVPRPVEVKYLGPRAHVIPLFCRTLWVESLLPEQVARESLPTNLHTKVVLSLPMSFPATPGKMSTFSVLNPEPQSCFPRGGRPGHPQRLRGRPLTLPARTAAEPRTGAEYRTETPPSPSPRNHRPQATQTSANLSGSDCGVSSTRPPVVRSTWHGWSLAKGRSGSRHLHTRVQRGSRPLCEPPHPQGAVYRIQQREWGGITKRSHRGKDVVFSLKQSAVHSQSGKLEVGGPAAEGPVSKHAKKSGPRPVGRTTQSKTVFKEQRLKMELRLPFPCPVPRLCPPTTIASPRE
ncbi:uncharacterized protein LOC104860173 [Fukomys damarensis]|uniref:uncharacterized protein LOC104860173 n=1 Tax=Fukomys damarensis TaxID=885580 RepID=UPI0005400F71|nr:uncharacterized protein LOC104860173 [Fukomys damarensis]